MNFKAAKLPMHNGQKYDLFKFKGGVYCRHKWQQILYKIKKGKEVGSDDLDDYKKSKTIPKSYEPKPRGRKQAKKAPGLFCRTGNEGLKRTGKPTTAQHIASREAAEFLSRHHASQLPC